jgi:putative ABC transport system ATP-binding protein
MTVYENVALPLRQRRLRGSVIRSRVGGILEELGLADKSRKTPLELSGGEQQRVAIARAVVHEPALVLADEPTGALDEETERGILDIFCRLHETGRTIIIVTHDRNVADTCGRTVRLRDGRVEEEAP